MSQLPMNEEPVNRSNKGFWLWVVVLFVALVILAWLFRFPWA